MKELDALRIAAEYSGESIDKMLSVAEKRGFHDTVHNKLRFNALHGENYIIGAFVLNQPVYITLDGQDRLDQLEEEAEEKAQQERQRRFENKISVLQILVPFITFFLGLVVEHYTGLISLFTNLFR